MFNGVYLVKLNKIYLLLPFIVFFFVTKLHTSDAFLVTSNQVGMLNKGMTIQDVMKIVPEKQIKKVVGYGEFGDPEYDDYEIYSAKGKHLLTITPFGINDLTKRINRVLIIDKRFKTTSGIGIGSSYIQIKEAYPNLTVSPDMDVIDLDITELNAWMSINKKLLPTDWWDNKNKRVDLKKIPLDAVTSTFIIWWK